MANFAYAKDQKRAINLDNVDSIECQQTIPGSFTINFYKEVGLSDKSVSGLIGFWEFDDIKKRDATYKTIVASYGMEYR